MLYRIIVTGAALLPIETAVRCSRIGAKTKTTLKLPYHLSPVASTAGPGNTVFIAACSGSQLGLLLLRVGWWENWVNYLHKLRGKLAGFYSRLLFLPTHRQHWPTGSCKDDRDVIFREGKVAAKSVGLVITKILTSGDNMKGRLGFMLKLFSKKRILFC